MRGRTGNSYHRLYQMAEGELRNAAAKRIERAAITAVSKDRGADLATALDRWRQAIAHLPKTQKNSRTVLVSQIAAEVG